MKERLTGAIILVALIVVLVPELLSGPIRPALRTRGPGSSAEEPPLRSYTINLADEAHGGSASLQPQPAPEILSPVPAVPSAVAERTTAQPAPPAAATPRAQAVTPQLLSPRTAPAAGAPKPAVAAPPPTLATQPAAPAAYVVQLGSFASRSNAERLAQQVHALGFQVSVSRGSTGRRLYRVQVGPARDHAAAEQMAAKLHSQGHAGTLVPK